MSKFLLDLLPFLAPLLVGIFTREIALFGKKLISKLQADPKTANLAEGVQAAEDALDAAITVAGNNPSAAPAVVAKAAVTAAKDAVLADKDALTAAALAEVGALASPYPAPVTAPGGASVNLPKPGGK